MADDEIDSKISLAPEALAGLQAGLDSMRAALSMIPIALNMQIPTYPVPGEIVALDEVDMVQLVDGRDVAALRAIAERAAAPDSTPKDKGGPRLSIVTQRMGMLAIAWLGDNGIPETRQELVDWLTEQCGEQLQQSRLKEIVKLACETYAAYLKSGR